MIINWNLIKWIAGILFLAFLIWAFNDWKNKGAEVKRLENNNAWQHVADSLKYSKQTLTTKEINNYVQNDPELKKMIKDQKIRMDRIESIMINNFKFFDSTANKTDLNKLLASIRANKPIIFPIKDSVKCMVIKGNMTFKNDSLFLNITDRQFNNKTTAIAYTERRLWKLLWFKTRFLGKKQQTAKITNSCGESQIINIQKSDK